MQKIRVLRVITWLPVGGIERKIVEVVPRLDPARFEPAVVCIRERGPLAAELEERGVPVHCIPFRTRWDPSALRRLAALMRELNTDVVHSHMYRSNVPATVAARIAGVPHVWGQVHNVNTWETARQLQMDRFLCRWREGMIAVSEQVRRDVIENLRLSEERVRLIYNGVNLERFGRPELAQRARPELRAESGAAPEDVVFLMAARIVEQKRPQDFLAMAAELLRREQADSGDGGAQATRPPTQFWIAGDGRMLDEMREAAKAMPIEGRVRFLGRRDDMDRVMAAADVFVMPSTKEGFSNALTEAMASGLAIVATDVGGNAEAVRSGTDGLIVPPLQPAALLEAAERVLLDEAFRRDIRSSARARAKRFSLKTMIADVERLYEQTVSAGR